MKARDKSRIIQWATGFAISLVMVVLLVGNGLCQDDLEQAADLHRQIIQLYQKGRYEEAIPLAKRSLAIREKALGPGHPDVATSLNNLASLYKTIGDYSRAEPLYKRSLAIKEKALGPDHPSVAGTKGNIGFLYLSQGKLDKAYEIFKTASWSTGLGRYYLLKKDHGRAEEQFREAMNHYKKTRESIHLLASYIGLGLSLEGLSRYPDAADSYQQAIELMEEQRAALSPAGRSHFLSGKVGADFQRILAYEGLVRAKGKLNDPAEAFFWSEYTKARLLLEAMTRGKTAPGLPSVLAQKEDTLTNRLSNLYKQRETAFAKNPALFKEIEEKELPQAKKKLAGFIETLRQNYPVYVAIRYPAPIPVANLSLRPDEALIAYEVTEKETYVWLIRNKEVAKAITIPVTRKELVAQVKQYRAFFEGITGYDQLSRFDPRMGKDLYDLLFKDLAADLKDGEQIIIIPDEILGILPFEAMVANLPARVKTSSGRYGDYPQGLKYLGDLYPISYYQSAVALWVARTLQKSGAMDKEKMLVVADPVFELADARVKGKKTLFAQRDGYQMNLMRAVGENWQSVKKESPFPRLSVTGLLAEKLRHSYGKSVDVLKGLDAIEQKLRRQPLDQYRYQVFATHGILDNEIPYIQEPALVLSQIGTDSQDRSKDGFLTMTEVMDLKLNADVAALTACNTGLGKNLTGEGVMGMGRAFQYAGARTVLMSLWSVEAESTNLLTEKFFPTSRQARISWRP